MPISWPSVDADHLLVSGAAMAAIEQELFASGLPVEALMEKAALAVSRRLLARPGQDRHAGLLVLVGPGHNGGDGLVVAREWHLAGGRARIWCPFERRRPLTDAHLRHARWLGIPLLEDPPDPADPALWVDALFGIGQHRPAGAAIETLLQDRQRQRPGALVAIDVPTGLDADDGVLLGTVAATASTTYSIGLIKRGLVQDAALRWVGQLERVCLGLPPALLDQPPGDHLLGLSAADRASAPWPVSDPAAGKYERGRLLVLAGSRRFRGAAHLVLAGATASGCGSLRAAPPRELAPQLWQVHPHVVLEPSLGATPAGGLALGDLGEGWLNRLDAVLLGPGLGGLGNADGPVAAAVEARERRRWQELVDFGGLLVLDADGLNRLGSTGSDWLQGRRGPTWITPHEGEFHRLFPDLNSLPRPEAALAAARRCGASVLLKGARSVVATPDGRRWQLLSACPDAARAGLGDVLAGYAAGRGAMALATVGLAPERGSSADGAWLAAAVLDHALAGLHCRERNGSGGVTPLAVAEALAQREPETG
ncbi:MULTISPECIES: NAD(P)H-hydrate epimerase [unclassified Cyanobium]|uniref:NAD(P)H-hydrate epimerase n=1 Tax=unclassified Cyanobium TaxID=2627006 RepID=UPI0020CCAA3A|nr:MULTISPECIES: NAD(P)H-hydrate epimerase [unclassified Cyanobium]MCP9833640.1 NAD(P)H-hydrate epimerase [Cyanobium sp. La Preciosa 7G6]MCP9936602.1 NAD(P)H-hydrate epimerase [Cyanobium sp. Aljojuca 7A6]